MAAVQCRAHLPPSHGHDGTDEAPLDPVCLTLPPHLPDPLRALAGHGAPLQALERTASTPPRDAILPLDARTDAMTPG